MPLNTVSAAETELHTISDAKLHGGLRYGLPLADVPSLLSGKMNDENYPLPYATSCFSDFIAASTALR